VWRGRHHRRCCCAASPLVSLLKEDANNAGWRTHKSQKSAGERPVENTSNDSAANTTVQRRLNICSRSCVGSSFCTCMRVRQNVVSQAHTHMPPRWSPPMQTAGPTMNVCECHPQGGMCCSLRPGAARTRHTHHGMVQVRHQNKPGWRWYCMQHSFYAMIRHF
jgi:hypothetical protein